MVIDMEKDISSEELMKVYLNVNELSKLLIESGSSPLAVAATLAQFSLSLYKTILNEHEYHLMVDRISASRDEVKPLIETSKPFDAVLH